jgi:hypothetical protein
MAWVVNPNSIRFRPYGLTRAGHTHQYLECEPAIAYAFDVEEKLVCVRLRFVQCPRNALVRRFHGDIPNVRHSHVRMCFQTERNNRYTNEKDGYNAHNLHEAERGERESQMEYTSPKWFPTTFSFYFRLPHSEEEEKKNRINFSERTSMMKGLNF